MARKLTLQERELIETLREALCEVLPPAQRGFAPGVASALVRIPQDTISDEDLERVLRRYELSDPQTVRLVRRAALVPVEGEKGRYVLAAPDALEAGESEGGALVQEEPAAEEAGLAEDESQDDYEQDSDPEDGAVDASESGASEAVSREAQEAGKGARSHQQGRRGRHTGTSQAGSRQLSDVPYVRRDGPGEDELRSQILKLNRRFWINGWLLSHPAAYTLYEHELVSINDALIDGALPGDITRRQLAYRMGGDEKFFEYGSDGFKLLRAMGAEDLIRHRPMPKPDLIFYAPVRRKHMNVLVTENLDPWLDVHDLMYEEGRTKILGERIHAVVLGGGMPVLEKNRLALLLDTLRADSVDVLYWGDIDRAGLELLARLGEVLGESWPVKPFIPAYQLMIERAMERYPDPSGNEETGQVNIACEGEELLAQALSADAAAYVHEVLEQARLIPQEILTRQDL